MLNQIEGELQNREHAKRKAHSDKLAIDKEAKFDE